MRMIIRLLVVLFALFGQAIAGDSIQDFMVWSNVIWQKFTPSGVDYSAIASLRFIDQRPTFHQGLFSGLVGYSFKPNLAAWGGYVYFPTQPVGRDHFVIEHRTVQRLNWVAVSHPHVAIEINSLLEQRYAQPYPGVAWRLREQVVLDLVPMEDFQPTKLSPLISDEIFLNLNHPAWVVPETFAQNRLFIGVSVPFNKNTVNFRVGYLNQYLYGFRRDYVRHIFAMAFVFTDRA